MFQAGQVSLECINCFSTCDITFEDEPPKTIHCPYCSAEQQLAENLELDFNE